MPSNKELQSQIDEVSELLGKEVDTSKMNNSQLSECLKGLNAELKAKGATAAPATVTNPKPAFAVAEGTSLTSKRGILNAGEEVTEKDLPGGKDSFENLVQSGHIVEG